MAAPPDRVGRRLFTIGIVVLRVRLVITQAVLVLGVIISIAGVLTMTAAAALFLHRRQWP